MNDSLFASAQEAFLRHWRRPAAMEADDRRLLVSGLPVFLALSLLFGVFYKDRVNPLLFNDIDLIRKARSTLADRENHEKKIYPVLLTQKYAPKAKTEQFRALSDVSAEGTGGITRREGFHTLTPHDEMDPGRPGQAGAGGGGQRPQAEPKRSAAGEERRPGDQAQRKQTTERRRDERETTAYRPGDPGAPGRGQTGSDFKIPANYRFEQDFALRYDSSRRLSIARQELAGFHYFQRMLRQIGQSWSLPGAIYTYRDTFGRVTSQSVAPQVVKVLFALDPDGRVRDVRVVASLGEERVDESCMSALRGQNFGPPPPAVLEQGNIFGINFIIPNALR